MSTSLSVREEIEDEPSGGWSRRRLLIIAAAVLLIAAAVTWIVAFSSVLGVRTVTIRGNHTVSVARIERAAQIDHGTPLVRLDTAGVALRVETIPDISSARVNTHYPSSVTITVTERVAVGVVASGSGYVLVDRTGDQYRSVATRPHRLPLFDVPKGTDSRTTGGAVATVAAALDASLRAKVASIQALDPQSITLLLADGRVVRWGSAADSVAKARVLPALLRRPGQQFDLTDPQRPFSR